MMRPRPQDLRLRHVLFQDAEPNFVGRPPSIHNADLITLLLSHDMDEMRKFVAINEKRVFGNFLGRTIKVVHTQKAAPKSKINSPRRSSFRAYSTRATAL